MIKRKQNQQKFKINMIKLQILNIFNVKNVAKVKIKILKPRKAKNGDLFINIFIIYVYFSFSHLILTKKFIRNF